MVIEKAYQQLVLCHQLSKDNAQLTAVKALDTLLNNILEQKARNSSLLRKVCIPLTKRTSVKGLYFYGKVGRGKTMLMDLFYYHLPIKRKQRIHFHRFMESVHQELNHLSIVRSTQKKSNGNPLDNIAKAWSLKVDIICFDEFFITDIGDAMLIAGILDALFNHHVTLVATSNSPPDALYRNGLQRERFIPTIELINKHCSVLSINGDVDHRLNQNEESGVQCDNQSVLNDDIISSGQLIPPYVNYAFPVINFPNFIKNKYYQYSGIKSFTPEKITINNRTIICLAKTEDVIAFDFYILCSSPRSQRDYIKLADQFSTVLVDNIPQFYGDFMPAVVSGVEEQYQRSGILMKELRHLDDEARRFIALVDELYDQGVRLILCAEVDIDKLYQSKQLSFEFERCQSRLFEMQKN